MAKSKAAKKTSAAQQGKKAVRKPVSKGRSTPRKAAVPADQTASPKRNITFRPAILISLTVLAGLIMLIWIFGPREPGDFNPPEISELPKDLDAWLYQDEAGIRPEVSRRIVWAGRPGAKTPVAIVYLHGFAATSQEIRPVPDLIAAWRGANLYFARLSGHGLDGESLDAARVEDWAGDVTEAVAIGKRIGEKVVVIGSSTGGTMAALAARDPELGKSIDGVVLISPNFGLRNRWVFLARQPLARRWLPMLGGRERCFDASSKRNRVYWTYCYPLTAIFPMTALVAEAANGDYTEADQPVLALWSEDDQVVSSVATQRVLNGWGGKVVRAPVAMGPGADPIAHVLAGDILSPGQTAPVATRINGWITQNFGE